MSKVKPIKIVIMGMDNSGKSTLVDLLTGECCDLQEPPNMIPTKGVKKEIFSLFDKNTVIWDFGGQEIYRNKYLKDPKTYFFSIGFFYYVVDVQDHIKQHTSAMYFKGVFQLIRKHSPDAKLVFLFHKNDPDFDSKGKNVKDYFMKEIASFLKPSKIKYAIYDTTIFDANSIKIAFKDEICATD